MARQLAVIVLVVPAVVAAGGGPGIAADFCPPRTVGISDAESTEGWAESTASLNFTVMTAGCAGGTVKYKTSSGGNGLPPATAGTDYLPVTGELSWAPGESGFQTISVPILGDGIVEPDESLTLQLYEPSGLSLTDSAGVGTILDDDPFTIDVELAASEPFCIETCVTCRLRVVASAPAADDVTVRIATRDGTAAGGSDFEAVTARTLRIPAGSTEARFGISILDDKQAEPDERFYVTVYAPSAGQIGDGTVTVVITDDDGTARTAVPGTRLHGAR